MRVSDLTLWQRARGGDAAAFGELFERHARAIYNYCFRRTADWSVAEELTSIVFLEAWRRRNKELAEDKGLPWLYGIATHVVRNRRRSARRYAGALARLPAPRPEPGFADDIDQRLDDQAQMARVLAAAKSLPQRQQDVLALCVWSGLTYEEAAVALGVPVGTVKSALSRARERLREHAVRSGHKQDELELMEPRR